MTQVGKIGRHTNAQSITPPSAISAEELEAYIAEAAYYKAEKRGFEAGFEQEDWLEAEKKEITEIFNG